MSPQMTTVRMPRPAMSCRAAFRAKLFSFISRVNARFDKYRRILPVPQPVMNENTNWKQNPGY